VLFQGQVTLVVKEAVQHIGSFTVCTLDGRAVERCVVVRDEGVEFECVIAEPVAVSALEHLALEAKTLTVTAGGPALAPYLCDIEVADGIDQLR
jgi:hypothetical protein